MEIITDNYPIRIGDCFGYIIIISCTVECNALCVICRNGHCSWSWTRIRNFPTNGILQIRFFCSIDCSGNIYSILIHFVHEMNNCVITITIFKCSYIAYLIFFSFNFCINLFFYQLIVSRNCNCVITWDFARFPRKILTIT